MVIRLESLVSATDLNRNSGHLLARAAAGDRLVVLSQNRPLAAIVGIDDLRRLQDLDLAASTSAAASASSSQSSAGLTTIGYTPNGTPVALKLACNTVCLGVTGSGKSVTLSAALANACDDPEAPVRFMIGEGKSDAAPLIVHHRTARQPPTVSVSAGLSDSPNAAHAFKRQLLDELEWRQNLLAGNTIQSRSDAALPNLVVVIDELDGLTAGGEDQHWDKFFHTLVSEGSEVGIYVWIFGQEKARWLIPFHALDPLFPQRIAHQMRDDTVGQQLIGREGSPLSSFIKESGQVLVKRNGERPQLVTIAAPDASPEPITATPGTEPLMSAGAEPNAAINPDTPTSE